MTVLSINYFDFLSDSICGAIFTHTGQLSNVAQVCRRFKEIAKNEAKKIERGLLKIFSAYPIQCLERQLDVANDSTLKKVDALFRESFTTQDKTGQHNSPYRISRLEPLIAPYVEVDDLIKFWKVLYKRAPVALQFEMDKVNAWDKPLQLMEEMRLYLLQNQKELESIEQLNLSNETMRELPSEIGLLVNLKSLNLSNNHLSSLPSSIRNLKKLMVLNLNKNRFSTFPPEVCNLTGLEHFLMCSNKISTLPQEISNLCRLKVFFLSGNQLDALPESIGKLSELVCLNLENNKLIALPETIGGLQALSSLFLFDNLLTTFPKSIGSLHELVVLSAAQNKLTTLPDELGTLRNLETLFLTNNSLEQLPPTLGQLAFIEELFIDGNRLTTLPKEFKGLINLRLLCFEGNPFESMPEALETLPCWSQDPQLYPHLEDLLEDTVLNANLSDKQILNSYDRLNDDKWLECIDGEYHQLGPEVFDKGLHGKDKEPGFLKGMINLFEFLKKNLNRKVDIKFYLEMHQIACSHFKGKDSGVEVGSDKIGVFRDSDDLMDAEFKNPPYAFSKEGIEEFYVLSEMLRLKFGPSFSLGRIVDCKMKINKWIKYQTMSREQVALVFNYFLTEFYYDIGQCKSQNERITAIGKLIQRLEWLHPPCDGCGRTDTALMNYLLSCYGFHPILMSAPYLSSCRGLKEWVQLLRQGLIAWENQLSAL